MSNLLEREAKVLIPAVGQGASDAAQQAWTELQSAAAEFKQAPLSSTGQYLSNHWQDFAAGAAIAAIAPSKAMSKLLLAWSLRGVGFATMEAVGQAANPAADLDEVRDKFAARLGHEAVAFGSSLPMALAGGAFGKMSTNAILGENKTLVDLARGRISVADLNRQNTRLVETLLGRRTRVLITDADDTLFSLKDYLVPSLQRNVAMISERMGLPEAEVIRALGPQRIHPWILEQSELARLWRGTPEQFTEQIVKPFWRNDAEAMRSLRPFPTVPETLQAARENGITVVALTNAPRPWAIQRLKAAGLDGYIDHLYAMEAPRPKLAEVVSNQSLAHGERLLAEAEAMPHKIGQIHTLPRGHQKPDVHGIERVLADLGVRPRHALAIGDNWRGDGAAPEYFGVPFIWAKYGRANANPLHKEFLRRFKPRADETKPVEAARTEARHPNAIHWATEYGDLLNFVRQPANIPKAWATLSDGMRPATIAPALLGWNFADGVIPEKPENRR